MWCWRNLLGVTYIDRKTNIEIIASIKPKRTLDVEIVKLALLYFGHVVRADSMELQMMLGNMDGQRRRGRPHITWLNNVQNYIANDNNMKILAEARNRVIWRGTVMDVARGQGRHKVTRYIPIVILCIHMYIFNVCDCAERRYLEQITVSFIPIVYCMSFSLYGFLRYFLYLLYDII